MRTINLTKESIQTLKEFKDSKEKNIDKAIFDMKKIFSLENIILSGLTKDDIQELSKIKYSDLQNLSDKNIKNLNKLIETSKK